MCYVELLPWLSVWNPVLFIVLSQRELSLFWSSSDPQSFPLLRCSNFFSPTSRLICFIITLNNPFCCTILSHILWCCYLNEKPEYMETHAAKCEQCKLIDHKQRICVLISKILHTLFWWQTRRICCMLIGTIIGFVVFTNLIFPP